MVATRKRSTPAVDVTGFAEQVTAAILAFGTDESYAVAMARAAVVISRKRAVWQARKDLRAAETDAHAQCLDTDPFPCHAVSACGTGDCKFAKGEHAQLTVGAPAGVSRRPQHPHEQYGLDEAINALAERRVTIR